MLSPYCRCVGTIPNHGWSTAARLHFPLFALFLRGTYALPASLSTSFGISAPVDGRIGRALILPDSTRVRKAIFQLDVPYGYIDMDEWRSGRLQQICASLIRLWPDECIANNGTKIEGHLGFHHSQTLNIFTFNVWDIHTNKFWCNSFRS